MLKIECESCKAPYQIDERRIAPTGLKMRCPRCGHSFVVKNPAAAAEAPPAAPPAAATASAKANRTMPGVGEGADLPPLASPVRPHAPPVVAKRTVPGNAASFGVLDANHANHARSGAGDDAGLPA